MSDILVPSEEELSRLIRAFVATSSMHDRMKVLDLAERFARRGRKAVDPMLQIASSRAVTA